MAIKFLNVYTREVRVAETEPMIAAMFNSGDLGPNAREGQDFGWRLAPEIVVEMRRIRQRPNEMVTIAATYNILPEDVDDKRILKYISDKTIVEDAPVAQNGDYEEEYRDEIRRVEKATEKISKAKSIESQ